MLRKRVATAAVLIPLLVAAVLYGKGWPFALFAGAVVLLCAREYFRMLLPSARDRWSGTAATVLAYLCGALLPIAAAVPGLFLCVAAAAFHFLSVEGTPGERLERSAISALGVVYIGGFLSLWTRTRSLPSGEHWIFLGILAIAAGDTIAYLVGRAFGKRPLSPAISPNKTVEGAVGGLLGSVICGTAYAAVFLPGVPAWYAFGGVALFSAVGQAGDLFESLIKRAAGVKDSGTLLPGHGGMFDRADSLIAAGPILHLLALLSTHAVRG